MRALSLAGPIHIDAPEETFQEKLRAMAEDFKLFMYGDDPAVKYCFTGQLGWDKERDQMGSDPNDVGAQPIYLADWQAAFKVAVQVAWAAQWMPRPTPGADPDGFVWLSYERGENRKLAIECRLKGDRPNGANPRLDWMVQGPLSKRHLTQPVSMLLANGTHSAVLEIAESARSVFGEGMLR